jgi:hypothetical protein
VAFWVTFVGVPSVLFPYCLIPQEPNNMWFVMCMSSSFDAIQYNTTYWTPLHIPIYSLHLWFWGVLFIVLIIHLFRVENFFALRTWLIYAVLLVAALLPYFSLKWCVSFRILSLARSLSLFSTVPNSLYSHFLFLCVLMITRYLPQKHRTRTYLFPQDWHIMRVSCNAAFLLICNLLSEKRQRNILIYFSFVLVWDVMCVTTAPQEIQSQASHHKALSASVHTRTTHYRDRDSIIVEEEEKKLINTNDNRT